MHFQSFQALSNHLSSSSPSSLPLPHLCSSPLYSSLSFPILCILPSSEGFLFFCSCSSLPSHLLFSRPDLQLLSSPTAHLKLYPSTALPATPPHFLSPCLVQEIPQHRPHRPTSPARTALMLQPCRCLSNCRLQLCPGIVSRGHPVPRPRPHRRLHIVQLPHSPPFKEHQDLLPRRDAHLPLNNPKITLRCHHRRPDLVRSSR
jgi:hypothetical protein